MRVCLCLYNQPFTRQHYKKIYVYYFIAILAEHLWKTPSFCCGLNDSSHAQQDSFLHATVIVQSPIAALKQMVMQHTWGGVWKSPRSITFSRKPCKLPEQINHIHPTANIQHLAASGRRCRNSQPCPNKLVTFLCLIPLVTALVSFVISVFNLNVLLIHLVLRLETEVKHTLIVPSL